MLGNEARCMVCGSPLGMDIMCAGVEERDVCSEECADIYYQIDEDEDGDENVTENSDYAKCKSIGCQWYDEKMEFNCCANENLCEKCINSQHEGPDLPIFGVTGRNKTGGKYGKDY